MAAPNESPQRSAGLNDPLYPKSGAYHEAGHAVTAAALLLRLSRHGIHVDSEGTGITYYEFRKPRRLFNHPSTVSREHTIIATLAGLFAQQKFHKECSISGASDDQNLVDMLMEEIKEEDTILGLNVLRAQLDLPKEAERLVHVHWAAIQALAEALWESPYVGRAYEPEPGWSTMNVEKRLDGFRIAGILKPFGIPAHIWDAEILAD